MNTLFDQFLKYASESGLSDGAYIVGGTVRDMVMGNEIQDADIVVQGDALAAGRAFSKAINATFVPLDEKFGIARIALCKEHIDICPMYGADITEDLGNRDLTINAMAVPVKEFNNQNYTLKTEQWQKIIIDPCGGRRDLEARIVRMVSEKNLVSDPLRLLRIYRFSCILGFSIDGMTSSAVQRHAALIANSAAERIAAELRCMLCSASSFPAFRLMQESGLLTALFPDLALNKNEEWSRLWTAYQHLEDILRDPDSYFPGYGSSLQTYFATSYRTESLKLSIIANDGVLSEQMARRLKFSNKEIRFISTISLYNRIISSISNAGSSTIIGLLRELGDDIYAVLVQIISLAALTPDHKRLIELAHEIIATYRDVYLPRLCRLPLIDGNDLINEFGLAPSPFFSDILSAVELLALEGHLHSRSDALKAAGAMIKDKGHAR